MKTFRIPKQDYSTLPNNPGIYKFLNQEQIAYVGKAKNLHKRVASYFSRSVTNYKTKRLIGEISHIEYVVVNSEFDALLLENSLIKENQPKYNILLKDDKSFPSICIANERFPRLYSTRRIDKSKGEYFGPYTSVKAMNNVIELLRKLYKIRTCNYLLSEENIAKKKFKVCLEYHIGNCLGPCEGLQKESEYLEEIYQAKEILKGNIGFVRSAFKKSMESAVAVLNFELAEEFKNKLDYLDKFQSKSVIVSQKISNTDVITLVKENDKSYVNYLMVQEGTLRVSETVEIKKQLDESDQQILQYAVLTLREKFQSSSNIVLSNISFDGLLEVEIIIPKIGDKKKLVDLSIRNALLFKNERQRKARESSRDNNTIRVLEQLKTDLRLQEMPKHIECFDNSNIQGSNPVASMVCFIDGKPSKNDYRKFNIKTVTGPDDFSSMKEIVYRRYYRLVKESQTLPQLIIIDGGKGQLNAATEALKSLNIYGQIPIIGIAKKLEEIYTPDDPVPLHIGKKSESLKLIQRIRDEAHRFAISFHRNKRSKSSLMSSLDEIGGIGHKTRTKLLDHFKSVNRIKEATLDEIMEVIGVSKGRKVFEHYKKR